MDIEKAEKVAELVAKLNDYKNQLELFNKTKEFTYMKITSEDNNEDPFNFHISYKNNLTLINEIREVIENHIYNNIKDIRSDLYKIS